ncbi:hypothetical protein N7530_003156 [Penicillium desertorum]|uniref:Zn(2)-C6 fungal-type domain-containing protein n=1 Tax=Penicillium desertorum TaxID=1303715 RepID=A0A9W9WW64_9EURO|nr:hypothetical protein N7530_003156 [Penicillium desertorum]
MAPSTDTPTDLHRAAVACLLCRKAKVRCLVSQRLDRCDRCISNDSECVFAQPKRARVRVPPYQYRPRRDLRPTPDSDQHSVEGHTYDTHFTELSPLAPISESISARRPSTCPSQGTTTFDDRLPPWSPQSQIPIITDAIRARIIAALATLKGKRGAPFSFVSSGDSPSFIDCSSHNVHVLRKQTFEQLQTTTLSLKLSSLLRPLKIDPDPESYDDGRRPGGAVKMPSYLSSMTLGQTVTGPIEAGMISRQASMALFEHFMVQMNAKWEYILDPHVDTHSDVQRRSPLLFASVLFCSSKFCNYIDGRIGPEPDPFLQTRLCSLARNLVIKTMAEGDRSTETMQAFYLLACWKDADDDISYLHSGYAFGILRDIDLKSIYGDGEYIARRRRTWLALFRQDRQQSLFFVRRAALNHGDDDASFLCDLDTWLKMPYVLPSDFVACCSADLRRIQSKLCNSVQKASSMMLPCLLEQMDAELIAWKSRWNRYLAGEGGMHIDEDSSLDPTFLHPGKYHLTALANLWEHSVRLHVASAILRQALMASVTSSLDTNYQADRASWNIDLSMMQQVLSPNLPGLSSSIEGAFGTLHNLINFPPDDLRRAPDTILLLGPNAALFLCLLLCLPGNGILGAAFQRKAVDLIQGFAQHMKECVQSPQDTVALQFTYLDSLVELLGPSVSNSSTEKQTIRQPVFHMPHTQYDTNDLDTDGPTLQAAQIMGNEIGGHGLSSAPPDPTLGLSSEVCQNLHMQGLTNLLDGNLFWEMLAEGTEMNISS